MLRKIETVDWRQKPCYSNQHNPPSHMVYEPGTYEWTCPVCGQVTRFVIHQINMESRCYISNKPRKVWNDEL